MARSRDAASYRDVSPGRQLLGAGRSPTLDVLVACLFVFLLQSLGTIAIGAAELTTLVAVSTPLYEAPWTIITSVYAHAGIWHLLGNAVLIALLGLIVERVTTWVRFQIFFLVTGALAGIVQTLVTGGAVLGASGAAFALLGYIITGNRLTDGLLDWLPIPPRWQLVGFVAIAAVIAGSTYAPGVALLGHFTGLFVGLIAGRVHLLRPS